MVLLCTELQDLQILHNFFDL